MTTTWREQPLHEAGWEIVSENVGFLDVLNSHATPAEELTTNRDKVRPAQPDSASRNNRNGAIDPRGINNAHT